MANLLEQYKNRLAVSEKVFRESHNGARMSDQKKLLTAVCLNNIDKFLTESFSTLNGTQVDNAGVTVDSTGHVGQLGLYKKFALNLTTVALPNLIAPELVMVHPMTSMSGYVTYLNYTYGSQNKDIDSEYADAYGSTYNSPFALGQATGNYTSNIVTGEAAGAGAAAVTATCPWATDAPTVAEHPDLASEIIAVKTVKNGVVTTFEIGSAAASGVVTVTPISNGSATITFASADAPDTDTTVLYQYTYNNMVVPQSKLPMLNVHMDAIPLIAKARRIAVLYSQMAAFQAKTDYGFDMGAELAKQAAGQLAYEIDTEVVEGLVKLGNENYAALSAADQASLVFNRAVPIGISMAQHFESFNYVLEAARAIIYNATKKFAPNWIVVAADVLPVITFLKGFTPAPATTSVAGPYYAGQVGALKVFVSPAMTAGTFAVGVLGSDMMSAAMVYAPYMPIVPTQLLQFADGGTTQGWSTLYDLKPLNSSLVVTGSVINQTSQYSYNTAYSVSGS